MNKKTVDKIVWWIPIRPLRNIIRHKILELQVETSEPYIIKRVN